MKIENDILTSMVVSVKRILPSFHSHKRKARLYAKQFHLAFVNSDCEFIIKEILHQQNRSIVKAVNNKKNIAIPMLGSFRYRNSLEEISKIKHEVKAQFGVTNMADVDEDTYEKINTLVETKKKEVLIPLYFKQHGGIGSTLNHNFLKK